MKITESTVRKLTISGVDRLDVVTVYLEDFGPEQGKATLECFGEAWSHYWGRMGEGYDIAKFLCRASTDYIVGKFSVGIKSREPVMDEEANDEALRAHIIKRRLDGELDREEARELWDGVDCACTRPESGDDIFYQVYGDEWWYSLPTEPNHKYEWLCRIVDTVKDALREASK